jgi:hypothetical protein
LGQIYGAPAVEADTEFETVVSILRAATEAPGEGLVPEVVELFVRLSRSDLADEEILSIEIRRALQVQS